jgi:hypothetical protein
VVDVSNPSTSDTTIANAKKLRDLLAKLSEAHKADYGPGFDPDE